MESVFSPSRNLPGGTAIVCTSVESIPSRLPIRWLFRSTAQRNFTCRWPINKVCASLFVFALNFTSSRRPCGLLFSNSSHSANPGVPR